MTSVWPVSLPTSMRIRDLSGAFGAGVIRSTMDAGPAKQRARFTAAPAPYTGSMLMTGTQVQTLLAFHRTTLSMGADSFEWTDPLTGSAAMVRMTREPQVAAAAPLASGDEYWHVQLSIEVLPDQVNPSTPEDAQAPHPDYYEWGPWYHAFEAPPAGEVDAAFSGTDVVDGSVGGTGGMDHTSAGAGWGGTGMSSGHSVIVPA